MDARAPEDRAAENGTPGDRAPRASAARRRAGTTLVVAGLALVLLGVFHVLNAVGSYESRDFAHRKRDYEVRRTVHERFPGALLRGLSGLGLALIGARLRRPPASGDGAAEDG